jgi:hypothetical protein
VARDGTTDGVGEEEHAYVFALALGQRVSESSP